MYTLSPPLKKLYHLIFILAIKMVECAEHVNKWLFILLSHILVKAACFSFCFFYFRKRESKMVVTQSKFWFKFFLHLNYTISQK